MAYELADGSLSTNYKVGDKFVVVVDSGTIIKDSIVELFEDDGTSCPLFKVIEGKCDREYNLCKGKAGAYKSWGTVRAYAVNKPSLFQSIKKVIKKWLSN